jgi:hypothetical protein
MTDHKYKYINGTKLREVLLIKIMLNDDEDNNLNLLSSSDIEDDDDDDKNSINIED